MTKEKKLTIKYTGGLDEVFDSFIEEFAKEHGYKYEGSGFNLIKEERDFSFYKKQDDKRS